MPGFHRHRLPPIVLLTAVSALAGCGNKGPLYLPDAEPVMPAPPGEPASPDEPAGTGAGTPGDAR